VAIGKGKTGIIAAFALGNRKTKKDLRRDGRSQDFHLDFFPDNLVSVSDEHRGTFPPRYLCLEKAVPGTDECKNDF
jgi:hypothetical protein